MTTSQELLQKAREHYHEGRFAEAEECCREILEADDRNIEAHLALGKIQMKDHRPLDARIHFQAVVRLEPENETARKYLEQLKAEEDKLLGLDQEDIHVSQAMERQSIPKKGCLPVLVFVFAFGVMLGSLMACLV